MKSISPSPKWDEQYRHMKRWQLRILALSKHTPESDDYHLLEDYLHSFFQTAWSLKDWLKNDNSVTIPTNVIEAFANASPMAVVGDIANGHKHLVLTAKNRGDNRLGSGYVMIGISVEDELITESDFSIHGTRQFTAVELVNETFDAWSQFLSEHKLTPSLDPLEELADIFSEAKLRSEE